MGGGEYHSIFDSYDDYVRFKDPDFAYGVALAQTMGRAALRLVNADVLPFEFQNFANTVSKYGGEVKQLADHLRTDTERQNRLLAEKRYEAVSDPADPLLPPAAHAAVPYLNFAPLDNALGKIEQSAQAYAQARAAGKNLTAAQQKELDQVLYQAEQQLLSKEGLPRRPWYRHQLYAPRLLHRLRRGKPCRHPRGHRGAQVARGGRANPTHRRGPGALRRPD